MADEVQPQRRFYLFSVAYPKVDQWGFAEAVCAGEHPIECVAAQRSGTRPGLRLVSWQEITEDEFGRFALLVRGIP